MSGTLLTSWESPHPPDCPDFDYERHPNWREVLPARNAEILRDLANGAIDTREASTDTRPVHRRLFDGLTPTGHDYFAGAYRGELHRCLRHYSVGIADDPRVGIPPHSVGFWMDELRSVIRSGINALDNDSTLTREDRLRYLLVFACRVFELFLRIHPYANGNGHSARFIVVSVLGRYGHWPKRWTIEPRPADPPYSAFIKLYRDGNRDPLEQFLASTLVP